VFPFVEELKMAPNHERDGGLSAPELAQRALDRELNAAPVVRQGMPVNDFTSMVVKKKRKARPVLEASGTVEKRKAEDGEAPTPPDKKVRLEEGSSSP
jgi:hypothetical protein